MDFNARGLGLSLDVYHNAWVMTQTAHIVDGFPAHALQPLSLSRIGAAGKHEILPHHQPHLVAEVIEQVIKLQDLKNFASPRLRVEINEVKTL